MITRVQLEEQQRIRSISRVDRSEIVEFFQKGFSKLPVYDPSQLSKESRVKYRTEHWTIPAILYPEGISDSVRETMRAWIIRHLSHYIPEDETIMVARENEELHLYRRTKREGEYAR